MLPLLLLLGGCRQPLLSCRSEYLYPNYLASDRIQTPDPDRLYFYGQQVIVYWNLPHTLVPAELKLEVRYGTRECETHYYPVTVGCGHAIYQITEDAYWCKEGIVAYKATLLYDNEPIADWSHHLWVELISFGDS